MPLLQRIRFLSEKVVYQCDSILAACAGRSVCKLSRLITSFSHANLYGNERTGVVRT